MRTALFLLLVPTLASAQDASPYAPLQWWGTAYVEHLIARGRLVDPTPLTRPFREADLLRALEEADSARLSGAEWRVVGELKNELRRRERGPTARLDLHAGIAASSHARRDALREAGAGHGTASGGAALTLLFGPVVAVAHPYFDTRLKYDPDWYGKKDRVIAGRSAEAYVSAQLRYAELFFGTLDRTWGPSAVEGILLSDSPYGLEHASLSLGTNGVRVEGIAAQLNSLPDTTGAIHNRYMVQHRLWLRPPGRWTVALWEGSVLEGVGRQLEPWYLNLMSLGVLAQVNTNTDVNSFVGFDVQRRGSVTVFAQGMLDDIQIDRASATDRKPASYGLTVGAQGNLAPVSGAWTLFYTRISNLAYRNEDAFQAPLYFGLGTGRNFSDYDQLTARVSLLPAHRALLTPEVTLLRQGEGDLHLAHPPVTAYDSTPAFLSGVVERTVRVAVRYQLSVGSLSLAGDGGVHLISNAAHVTGANKTRWVGTIALTYRYRKESLLP
ncbi:MAG TPA: hypothetical protein VGQ18_00760 [Gemmatimonadales bacterium]|nr:hypothetical protein [Gemmatimonadales bacterium]